MHVYTIVLNVNRTNALIKRHRVPEEIKNKIHTYVTHKKFTKDLKTHSKSKGLERYSMQMKIKRKPWELYLYQTKQILKQNL